MTRKSPDGLETFIRNVEKFTLRPAVHQKPGTSKPHRTGCVTPWRNAWLSEQWRRLWLNTAGLPRAGSGPAEAGLQPSAAFYAGPHAHSDQGRLGRSVLAAGEVLCQRPGALAAAISPYPSGFDRRSGQRPPWLEASRLPDHWEVHPPIDGDLAG